MQMGTAALAALAELSPRLVCPLWPGTIWCQGSMVLYSMSWAWWQVRTRGGPGREPPCEGQCSWHALGWWGRAGQGRLLPSKTSLWSPSCSFQLGLVLGFLPSRVLACCPAAFRGEQAPATAEQWWDVVLGVLLEESSPEASWLCHPSREDILWSHPGRGKRLACPRAGQEPTTVERESASSAMPLKQSEICFQAIVE